MAVGDCYLLTTLSVIALQLTLKVTKGSLIDSEDIHAVGNTFDIAPSGKNIERGEHARAGEAGSHGEIRALDDLLKHLERDKKMTVTDNTLEKILAYNYNFSHNTNALQPPCIHCFFLTDLITFVGY
jgi:hypothetical protein